MNERESSFFKISENQDGPHDTLPEKTALAEQLSESDDTELSEQLESVIEAARESGVPDHAISDMCQHENPARLIQRAIRETQRLSGAYSQAVHFILDNGRVPTTKDELLDYAQAANRITPRYAVEAQLAGQLEVLDFEAFISQAQKRAQEIIIPKPPRRPKTDFQRQLGRNLLAAQQYQQQLPVTPSTPKFNLGQGDLLAKKLNPDQFEALRQEYSRGNTSFIKRLDACYLGNHIIDFSSFPAVSDACGDEVMNMVIISDKTILLDGKESEIPSSDDRQVLNVLLLLKGQPVTFQEMSGIGLSVDRVEEIGKDLCDLLKDDNKDFCPIFQTQTWGQDALQASSQLSIFDIRQEVNSQPIFRWSD